MASSRPRHWRDVSLVGRVDDVKDVSPLRDDNPQTLQHQEHQHQVRPEARVVAERALVEAERALRRQNLRDRVAGVAVPRLAGGAGCKGACARRPPGCRRGWTRPPTPRSRSRGPRAPRNLSVSSAASARSSRVAACRARACRARSTCRGPSSRASARPLRARRVATSKGGPRPTCDVGGPSGRPTPGRGPVWKSNFTARSSRLPAHHRRDACSMGWRCRFLIARRSQHPTHWSIFTQVWR